MLIGIVRRESDPCQTHHERGGELRKASDPADWRNSERKTSRHDQGVLKQGRPAAETDICAEHEKNIGASGQDQEGMKRGPPAAEQDISA